jgi:pimeloyl-ACP methyl ester carboxylesterase
MIDAGTTRDVALSGVSLRVTTWGEAAGPERTVLFVHGLTANSQTWADLGPRFAAAGWHAIAPDLRGRGLSEKPAHGYGLPFHAADLLDLLDGFGLPSVNWVGHSLGALIGLFMAAVHRGRIAKLVLVDAGGKLPADTIEAIAPALARLGVTYPSLDAYLEKMSASPAHPWDPFWERYYRYDAETLPGGAVTSRVPKRAIDEELATNWTIRTDALPEVVRTPTLIVRATVGLLGPDRGLLLPAEEAQRLISVIPGSRAVDVPDANHYTVIQSSRFAGVLQEWLTTTQD